MTHVATHVSESVKQSWEDEAEERDMSLSEYVKMMVSAGRKKFERSVEVNESRTELRKQRNDLRDELIRARERINSLERQLSATERNTIIDHVQDNPGATRKHILQELLNSTTDRVGILLNEMEGAELRLDDEDRYYVSENREGGE